MDKQRSPSIKESSPSLSLSSPDKSPQRRNSLRQRSHKNIDLKSLSLVKTADAAVTSVEFLICLITSSFSLKSNQVYFFYVGKTQK